MKQALRTFGAAVAALDSELDWTLLGRTYCEGDGAEFFDAALRARIVDTALLFADDVASALAGATGGSVYLGAEVAELPLMLAEHLVLGRRVHWINLDGPRVRELARALAVVATRLEIDLPMPRTDALSSVEPASCNHVWMVSVLDDPDAFPALHDALYERTSGQLATGRGAIEDDRARADVLVDALLDCASDECLVSSSEEEWSLIEPRVARRGWQLERLPGGRVTAVVGDRVRMARVRRSQ